MTGLVDPAYGATDASLGLYSIRERRYRGYCRNNEHLEENIALFNTLRPQIEALFTESPHLSGRAKKSHIAYIDKFYTVINKEKLIDRKINGWCHASRMVSR